MANQVTSNGADYASGISTGSKHVTLRKYSDNALTWDEFDNNFELLRSELNATITDTFELAGTLTTALIGVNAATGDMQTEITTALNNSSTNAASIVTNAASIAVNTADIQSHQNGLLDIVTWKTATIEPAIAALVADDVMVQEQLTAGGVANGLITTALDTLWEPAMRAAVPPVTIGTNHAAIATNTADIATNAAGFVSSLVGIATVVATHTVGIATNSPVPLQVAGGPTEEPAQTDVETLGAANVTALTDAITAVLATGGKGGTLRLPAGRIYLNAKITIVMPATVGHNFPNGLTIQGEGQGVTQLCWTNNSATQGIEIELGPYGAVLSQKVSVRDLDFVLGNQGTSTTEPLGIAVPVNQAEGLLGAKGTALFINADRTKLAVNPVVNAALGYNRYDHLQGLGLKPSCLIENCNFMSWHWSYAGWDKCIEIEDAQLTDIKGCCFTGYVGPIGGGTNMDVWWASTSAIHITSDAKATDFFLEHLRFFGFEYGVLCDGNIEGVTISQSTFVNTQKGVYWNVQEILNEADTGGIGQWPLLILTDCHLNCKEMNVYIQNGWEVIIKGCSMYGFSHPGVATPPFTHRSIYIGNKSSNVLVTANNFVDATAETTNTAGGFGPSIECLGHACHIEGNTFLTDADEPHVLLEGRASGNVIRGNTITGGLAPANVTDGIPANVGWSAFTVTDNSSDGSYARRANTVADNV